MKKLAIVMTVLMVFSSVSFAHNGAISLYLDETPTDCDYDLAPFLFVDIYILHVKGDGPELGRAVQFRILSTSAALSIGNAEWNPATTLTLGSLTEGISISFGKTCLGQGNDVTYIGKFQVFNTGDSDTARVKVVDDPTDVHNPGIYITLCEENDPKYRVLGGTFVINGSCDPAVEPKSWGAIKSMFE